MKLADRLNRIIEDRQISKAEFARRIGVTVNTVNYYLRKAYKKLNVHSREELVELLESIGIPPNMNS
ncbi:MAG: winged helix-turn-helix transcriptional regulator [Clostridia bacterium]|nr:winged helix-turn-helix transcriptional regulator [Clostridia bacterium]